MSKINGLWMDKHEEAAEAFLTNEIDEQEFRSRLRALGFDEANADAEVDLGIEARFQSMKHEKDTVYG